jgi:hypothetical protein
MRWEKNSRRKENNMARTWIMIGDRVEVKATDGSADTYDAVVVKAGPDVVEVRFGDPAFAGPVYFAWQDLMGAQGGYLFDDELMGHPFYEAFDGFELVKPWSEIVVPEKEG